MHYFVVLVIISVCVKCFNIDVRIYSTLLLLPLFFVFLFFCFCLWFHPGFFVILILMYAFIVLVLFLIVKRILRLIMYSSASL